jgi:hypothetical protein
VAVNARVTISLLIVLSGVSFAFAGQFANPGDAAMVKTLASELRNATVITRFEDLSNDKRRVFTERALGFKFEGDFNGDGRQDVVLLGKYGSDRPRSFLLITTNEGGKLTRAALLTFDQEFVVGRRYDNRGLALFFCVSCDAGGRLEWTGSQYVVRPFPPAGVQ